MIKVLDHAALQAQWYTRALSDSSILVTQSKKTGINNQGKQGIKKNIEFPGIQAKRPR